MLERLLDGQHDRVLQRLQHQQRLQVWRVGGLESTHAWRIPSLSDMRWIFVNNIESRKFARGNRNGAPGKTC
ncbi:hypothetical protein [Cupriavidus consociatus]|uniref:hypothetical protein n=1 Tax=Cupriavidus consociatus TaxID=2821357 RepID=UPI001AE2C7CA|nr:MULTISPECIES: hypothetical protein [unclassified Cupriavidus]MBP0624954.1 hypothetical protein [Cupriavidus sp. LEh25]MDK2661686.1 hypothetical protein [Cupriavidus sp. LEh21]